MIMKMIGRRLRALSSAAADWLGRAQTGRDSQGEVRGHRRVLLHYPPVKMTAEDSHSLSRAVDSMLTVSGSLDAEDRRALGTALARLGRLEEALELFEGLAVENPTDLRVAHDRGVVLAELYRNEEAVKVLAPVARAHSPALSTLAAYGDALVRTGREREAALVYEQGLRLRRNDMWFLASLAHALGSGR